MSPDDSSPPVIFCKGCGLQIKRPSPSQLVHTADCLAQWEYGCLLAVEEAAREAQARIGDDCDQLDESIAALDECREAASWALG